jgi:predicted RNA-binding protein with PUA-like domain
LLRRLEGLEKMELFRQGRLSITPVSPKEWSLITKLEGHW